MKDNKFNIINFSSHWKNIFKVTLIAIVLSYIIRVALVYLHYSDFKLQIADIFKAFCLGWVFDFSMLTFALIPLIFIPPLFSIRKNNLDKSKRSYRNAFVVVLTFLSILFVFLSVAEFAFWDEFHARFNFIAVDYLIYTQEVVHNIMESYPIAKIGAGVGLIVTLLIFFLRKTLIYNSTNGSLLQSLKKYFVLVLPELLLLLFMNSLTLSGLEEKFINNQYSQEIAKNGPHSLFHAFFYNEIKYNQFYATRELATAIKTLKKVYSDDSNGEEIIIDETQMMRKIHAQKESKNYNVILVSMESMSAAFLGAFGNPDKNTPNLDQLSKEGLFFKNIFSTGTRTVRGLEALMLSVPPTPGQSIVRRPQSDHLYSIGQVLKDAGYATEFLYGGYSYFDNMKNFFSSNGMTVWDQATLSKNEISFSNAWGVCDEDLFDLSIRRADKLSSEGRPFFQIVMTTSNHRPYTYPQKIDVPSGSGRGGAIRYSDYAIGQLIQKSKNKSWFKNTLFVFVADHDASVAGYTKVPVKDFRIPLIFYMPNVIKPEVSSKLGSQIDVAPTILSLLNKSYESHFFGHDLLHSKSERALLGNYQSVGLYKQNILTLLSPNQKIEQFRVATDDSQEKMNDLRGDLIEETISYYQTASWLFSSGLMRAK